MPEDHNPLSKSQFNCDFGLAGSNCFTRIGETIFSSLPVGVVVFDGDMRIIQKNLAATEMLTPDDSIVRTLAEGTDPAVWQNWRQALERAMHGDEVAAFERVAFDRNGRTRLLNMKCRAVQQTPRHGILVIEDITEEAAVQRELDNAERMASLGKVAARVAHELNNPLDGILRYLNLAMRLFEGSGMQKGAEYLQQCRKGLARMADIVGELLEFSRNAYPAFENRPLDGIVDDALRSMEPQIMAAGVEVTRQRGLESQRVLSGNLFQVFCNLVKNALDAMPDGGRLSVITRRHADGALVEFGDTGHGFDPGHADRIFEPFFTTKPPGKGTGLGLAICKDIVEKYNGRITARNGENGGSVFTVYIPLNDKPETSSNG